MSKKAAPPKKGAARQSKEAAAVAAAPEAPKDKHPGGRPTEYRYEYAAQAERLCKLLGATDAQLAEFFGVTEQTINNWKLAHEEFFESIRRGKVFADAVIAEALFHRAKGYSHSAVKIMQDKGEPLVVDYVEHYPPDTAAASLWLRNRQPEKWRDKVETEHSTKPGDPIANFLTAVTEGGGGRLRPPGA